MLLVGYGLVRAGVEGIRLGRQRLAFPLVESLLKICVRKVAEVFDLPRNLVLLHFHGWLCLMPGLRSTLVRLGRMAWACPRLIVDEMC